MKVVSALPAIAIAVSSLISPATAALFGRQSSTEAYLTSVCSPNVTDPNPVPPCIEIISIESACAPNGTLPLDYLAHAECMCNGGYFSNWLGCLNCEYVHGGRSPQLVSAFKTILASASNELCTGTPTASFAAIFNSVNGNPAEYSTSALSDQFPSQTAVSLYYTATGPQGLGAITGNATAATRTAGATSSSVGLAATGLVTPTGTTVVSGSVTGSSSSSGSASVTSTSSKAEAAPTGSFKGLMAVAMGAAVAAL